MKLSPKFPVFFVPGFGNRNLDCFGNNRKLQPLVTNVINLREITGSTCSILVCIPKLFDSSSLVIFFPYKQLLNPKPKITFFGLLFEPIPLGSDWVVIKILFVRGNEVVSRIFSSDYFTTFCISTFLQYFWKRKKWFKPVTRTRALLVLARYIKQKQSARKKS